MRDDVSFFVFFFSNFFGGRYFKELYGRLIFTIRGLMVLEI